MPLEPDAPVIIVPYNPDWPGEFAALARVLAAQLGSLAQHIEHIGSTAVPGLAAKPIIDIDVVIENDALLPAVITSLAGLGYTHAGDQGIPGRQAFKRQGEHVPLISGETHTWMDHHLYVCAQNSAEFARHIAFRDRLRRDPQLAERYAALKRVLAEQYKNDRDAYTEAKTDFVTSLQVTIQP
jgi:GrpB-like predicted nucleotidyltransferase (UPF0157 family)